MSEQESKKDKSADPLMAMLIKAAEDGNPDAQYNLGIHLWTNKGENPAIKEEALKCIRVAATQEHKKAKKLLQEIEE